MIKYYKIYHTYGHRYISSFSNIPLGAMGYKQSGNRSMEMPPVVFNFLLGG
jgi:hypothetical protein